MNLFDKSVEDQFIQSGFLLGTTESQYHFLADHPSVIQLASDIDLGVIQLKQIQAFLLELIPQITAGKYFHKDMIVAGVLTATIISKTRNDELNEFLMSFINRFYLELSNTIRICRRFG